MPWTCRLVPFVDDDSLEVGDMFYADPRCLQDEVGLPFPMQMAKRKRLSAYYFQNNSHRLPLILTFPLGVFFCLDSMTIKDGQMSGGWTVIGDAPMITVHPSINLVGHYHGWLQAGVLTDDVDGRVFPAVDRRKN